jgi:hypothetical protein
MSNQDIVSEMMGQMNLSPAMAEQLQNQQAGGYHPMGEAPGGGMDGLPHTPEEQMRLMQSASQYEQQSQQSQQPQYQQQNDQQQNDQYDSSSVSSSQATAESDLDLEKAGLAVGTSKTLIDTIGEYLKDPLIVIVFYVIISLTQVDTLIRKVLPAIISQNVYYYLGTKAFLLGLAFLISKLILR